MAEETTVAADAPPAGTTPAPAAGTGRRIAVWVAVIAAALVTGFAWALSSPIGSSPDDDYHMASIWCPPPLSSSGCQVEYRSNGTPIVYVPQQVSASSVCYAFHPEIPGACTGNLSAEKLVATDRVDSGQYPGPYYRFMHLFVRGSVVASVAVMRLVNVLIAVAMGTLVVLVMPAFRRRFLGWSTIGTIIPLGLFLVASINPSSWTILGVLAFSVALDSALRANTRLRGIAACAVALAGAALAAISRADGGLYVILMLGAIGLLNVRRLRQHLEVAVLAAAILALGLWSLTSSTQASMAGTGLGKGKIEYAQDLVFNNVFDLPSLWLGIYAIPGWGLGWLDTAVPALVWMPLILIAGLLVRAGILRAGGMQRFVSGAILFGCGAMPVYLLSKTGDAIGVNYQPRYVLPLLMVLLYVLLRPDDEGAQPLFKRRGTTVMYASLVAIHSLALLYVLRRYTVGTNGHLWNVGGTPWWWTKTGPGPIWVWLGGTLGFAVVAYVALGATFLAAVGRRRKAVPRESTAITGS